jgi:anaerobic selenocysteine-containing dehydrogenase
MTATRTLDASISKAPLALDGDDLATVCVLCSHNCGVRVDVRAGRISAVRADETCPITSGYICNKAVSIPFYVSHAQRLEHPLRRRTDGSFERIAWDTAIAEIAAKLGEIRKFCSESRRRRSSSSPRARSMRKALRSSWLRRKRWRRASPSTQRSPRSVCSSGATARSAASLRLRRLRRFGCSAT